MSCRRRIALLRLFTPLAFWWHAITPVEISVTFTFTCSGQGWRATRRPAISHVGLFMAFTMDPSYVPATDTRSTAAGYNQ
jgi:hypothetical protein